MGYQTDKKSFGVPERNGVFKAIQFGTGYFWGPKNVAY